jgi:hypothetical protein
VVTVQWPFKGWPQVMRNIVCITDEIPAKLRKRRGEASTQAPAGLLLQVSGT